MPKRIRVLVVDDSAFMRKLLSMAVDSDPACKVIKTAGDGLEALKAVEKLKPDVVTLDIELPEIDGLTVLVYIMQNFPCPVVMVTGFSKFLGIETVKALEYGAAGMVRKPKGPRPWNIESIKKELVSQIKLAAEIDVRKLMPVAVGKRRQKRKTIAPGSTNRVVVIATSSGGPRALGQVIPGLPGDLAAGVLVVQHMPAEYIPSLAERLNWESALQVKVAEDLEPIQQGKVLVMPSQFHCRIGSGSKGKKGEVVRLTAPSAEEDFHFALADELMISLAHIYGRNAGGVILTGMGNDGTEGLRALKECGGYTMAEDESTCVVYGMPKSAVQAGVVDRAIPLHRMADEIVRRVNNL